MKPTIKTLDNWPKLRNGQPVFHSTEEALLFAQLIFDKPDEQAKLQFYRDDCYIKLKHQRESKQPALNYMVTIAVRAQLFRECLEECQRINNEKFNRPGA